MDTPAKFSAASPTDGSTTDGGPRVTIEMGGPNLVIRSATEMDREYTNSLVHALNAAADADTVVVIDPAPIRCDDAFTEVELPVSDTRCPHHEGCRPADVEVVAAGIIRIPAEHTWWTIDLRTGRLCRTDTPVGVRFLGPRAWTSVIALHLTPTKVSALRVDHTVVTSRRAHQADLPLAS